MEKAPVIPLNERLVVTPTEFRLLVGIGSDRMQQWLLDETFPAFRDAEKKGVIAFIPLRAAEEWLNQRGELRLNMPRPLKRFDPKKGVNRK